MDVNQRSVDGLGVAQRQTCRSAFRPHHGETVGGQQIHERVEHTLLIIDYEQGGHEKETFTFKRALSGQQETLRSALNGKVARRTLLRLPREIECASALETKRRRGSAPKWSDSTRRESIAAVGRNHSLNKGGALRSGMTIGA